LKAVGDCSSLFDSEAQFCVGDVVAANDDITRFYGGSGGGSGGGSDIGGEPNDAVDVVVAVENRCLCHIYNDIPLTPSPFPRSNRARGAIQRQIWQQFRQCQKLILCQDCH